MSKQTRMKTPREYFLRAAADEFSKFERNERAFRRVEREERAAQLRLPTEKEKADARADWLARK
jgi:hypothetical protein